jgi:hypothetical protein
VEAPVGQQLELLALVPRRYPQRYVHGALDDHLAHLPHALFGGTYRRHGGRPRNTLVPTVIAGKVICIAAVSAHCQRDRVSNVA